MGMMKLQRKRWARLCESLKAASSTCTDTGEENESKDDAAAGNGVQQQQQQQYQQQHCDEDSQVDVIRIALIPLSALQVMLLDASASSNTHATGTAGTALQDADDDGTSDGTGDGTGDGTIIGDREWLRRWLFGLMAQVCVSHCLAWYGVA